MTSVCCKLCQSVGPVSNVHLLVSVHVASTDRLILISPLVHKCTDYFYRAFSVV